MMDFLSVVVSVYLCNLFAFLRVNTSKFNDADPPECLRVVRACVCKYASMCVCVCARLGDIKPTLRWRTVLEIRARSHGGTNNFNSLDRDRSEGSLSLRLTTPPRPHPPPPLPL